MGSLQGSLRGRNYPEKVVSLTACYNLYLYSKVYQNCLLTLKNVIIICSLLVCPFIYVVDKRTQIYIYIRFKALNRSHSLICWAQQIENKLIKYSKLIKI